jgi:CheY-like chemotaxis protein
VVAAILGADGHHVVEAANGAEGLARMREGCSVDLVLTDLGMPGMTGWEVARAVKALQPAVLVGLLTGWEVQPEDAPEDRAAVDFIISKPVTREGLRAAITQALGRQRAH